MNIGIFTDTYSPVISGVVTSTKILKKELENLGHNVTIVTVKHPELKIEEEENILRLPSIPFLPLKTQRVGSVYSTKIWKKIKKLNLDIIHTQTEFSIGLFGRIVAKRLGLPVIHTYHTMYEDYVHYIAPTSMLKPAAGFAKRVSKAYCKDCNAVIVPTSKVKDKLEEYGLKHDFVEIIPTGIDLEPFKRENHSSEEGNELRKEFGLNNDNKVVLFIGRIAKEKSIDVVINAMKTLIQEDDTIRMLIVGDGPALEELKELADRLSISDYIIFAGEKPWKDIGKYYQLGDVFVSASITETQGLTFSEAMAAKVPVVAKYDKNLEDILKHEKNGLIFKEDHELSHVLKDTLNDNTKRSTIAEQAFNEIEPLSSKHFGKKVSDLYREVFELHNQNKIERTV
ncbi:glycosyltransferase family 4 protein [Oceanirhabdus sp. W0125-5]|uniref:glycosyltransferase family 4 protein n=1 Tax=Oceanirhabdus sp. W0125-5 TaxID=2999116 RepID=UPI0022F33091|nr:glycosyltransferase family 4 protein [Oceanirhabdus sp. W0125-5]WBW98432.1 glycosyltransferase family 4 protein [Oceanirhabdus sp. W0125-5]